MTHIYLPGSINIKSVSGIMRGIIKFTQSGNRDILLDVTTVNNADTSGLAAFAVIADGFTRAGVNFHVTGLDVDKPAVNFMHASGFFKCLTNYSGEAISHSDRTVIPFHEIDGTNHVGYIHLNLKPWMEAAITLSSDTVATLCACISEAFQNVEHHGGATGYGIAEFYPQKEQLHITVADLGMGIPHNVQQLFPEMNDAAALRKSTERGFTTKRNYKNRGFGLDNLIRYVVGNNGGEITLRSRSATLFAKPHPKTRKILISTQSETWRYPGTLVHISLRTDTLEKAHDARQEKFEW